MQGNYDEQFRIRTAVPEFEAYVERYRELSAETRRRLRSSLDCSYGSSALERLDIFVPESREKNRPLHVFFHGGYWRAFDKSDYSFVAGPIVAANAVAVIANYGLMPLVSMSELISHCREVIRWLFTQAPALGANRDRISVSGHSAGAHIAVLLAMTHWEARGLPRSVIKTVTAVSGLYDLKPVLCSFLREETHLTENDVADFSPMMLTELLSIGNLVLAYGSDETQEFRRQTEDFARAVLEKGVVDIELLRLPNHHHMSTVLDLSDAESQLGTRHIENILHRK